MSSFNIQKQENQYLKMSGKGFPGGVGPKSNTWFTTQYPGSAKYLW
jgi:hypothetical protein